MQWLALATFSVEISSFLGTQGLTNPANIANRHSLFQWSLCKMLSGWREFTLAPETDGSAGREEEPSFLCSCPWEPKGGVTLSNDFSSCTKLKAALDSLPWTLWWFCFVSYFLTHTPPLPLLFFLSCFLSDWIFKCVPLQGRGGGSCFLFLTGFHQVKDVGMAEALIWISRI